MYKDYNALWKERFILKDLYTSTWHMYTYNWDRWNGTKIPIEIKLIRMLVYDMYRIKHIPECVSLLLELSTAVSWHFSFVSVCTHRILIKFHAFLGVGDSKY